MTFLTMLVIIEVVREVTFLKIAQDCRWVSFLNRSLLQGNRDGQPWAKWATQEFMKRQADGTTSAGFACLFIRLDFPV